MDFFVETAANFRKFRRQQTMKTIFALAVVLLLSMRAPAEIQAPVPLWPDGAPGASPTGQKRQTSEVRCGNLEKRILRSI
jgi:hypothetical protein